MNVLFNDLMSAIKMILACNFRDGAAVPPRSIVVVVGTIPTLIRPSVYLILVLSKPE